MHTRDLDAVHEHLPSRRVGIEAGDDAEQRALAAPRRSDDADKLAALNTEAHSVQNLDPLLPERKAAVDITCTSSAAAALLPRFCYLLSLDHSPLLAQERSGSEDLSLFTLRFVPRASIRPSNGPDTGEAGHVLPPNAAASSGVTVGR